MRRVIGILLTLLLLRPALGSDDVARLLAEGDPETLTTWAQRYEHGEGVDRDVDTAVRLYCRAARAGHAVARYQLGWLYANGRGVARNDTLAAAWFSLAAAQGDVYAQRMLSHYEVPAKPVDRPACLLSDGSSAERPLGGSAHPMRPKVVAWVEQFAPGYRLDPKLVLAVIQVESNFNPRALSPRDARGLMQLIPATAERFGVNDVWDPIDNLHGGMTYLRWLLDYFDGDVTLALAAYNAGERAVERHGGVPPYPETRAYVRNVSRLAGLLRPG
jgi:soluble lytic murein transglycosylase-like protein